MVARLQRLLVDGEGGLPRIDPGCDLTRRHMQARSVIPETPEAAWQDSRKGVVHNSRRDWLYHRYVEV